MTELLVMFFFFALNNVLPKMFLPYGLLLLSISPTVVVWQMKAPLPTTPLPPPTPPPTPRVLFEKAAERQQTLFRILKAVVVPVAREDCAADGFCFSSLLLNSFILTLNNICTQVRSHDVGAESFFLCGNGSFYLPTKLEIDQKKKSLAFLVSGKQKKATNPYCAASPGTFCVGAQWSIIRMLTAHVFSFFQIVH